MDIYIIEYVEDGNKFPLALLEDRKLVDIFMSTRTWENGKLNFIATHFKKEECGVLKKVDVLDYSHLRPLPKIRIPPF